MELLVVTEKGRASPLVSFLEERGVRVRLAPPDAAVRSARRPDAIVVCASLAAELVEGLRRLWPGAPLLTCDLGTMTGEGDAAGPARPAHGPPRGRRGAGKRRVDAADPGELAFRLAQLVHAGGAPPAPGTPGRGGSRVA